jgi:phenylalanyl-tRNA synthetase beta chain
MKFSEQWLREWVSPDVDTATLAHQLTMAGLEVDAIEPVAAEFTKVVVGEVLTVEPHPDADKLRVCKVNVGEEEALNIVCGAANVRPGLKVPVALVGARLPGDFKIKKSKLRGVPSHGMLCSAKELGLAEEADGLLELAADAPVSQDIRRYLELDDVSIELGITPNRGDCLSVLGVARETAVLNEIDFNPPEMSDNKILSKRKIDVSVKAPADCPVYAGRVISGINNKAETPGWIQEKLRRSGLRSLGPVIDVTNYVLLELGQPMHAFDTAKLDGAIQVRTAEKNEKLTLLNDQNVDIVAGTLLIADESKPLALAGIMGGADSAVSDTTTEIFLESAFFKPLAIAGKARSYGLHTDSSHRFERGVDFDLQRIALERATSLLLEIVGGEAGPVTYVRHEKQLPNRNTVSLRYDRIQRVLGTVIEKKDVEMILKRLGLNPLQTKEGWTITPPAFRFDIEIEEDLLEELARIHGYDNLPATRPRAPLVMPAEPESAIKLSKIKQTLVDVGYSEVITYSFVDPKQQNLIMPGEKAMSLVNPISADMADMRTSLIPGLLQAVQYNLNRQQNRLLFFECGLKFVLQGSDLKQNMVISAAVTGTKLPEQWGSDANKVDFYDVKADVENLIALTGEADLFEFKAENNPILHLGQSANILKNGEIIGYVGALHPVIEQNIGLSQRVFVFELDVNVLRNVSIPAYRAQSRFPSIRRDIALVVDQEITALSVIDCIKQAASSYLTKVELFDVYVGEGIDSGRKSLAMGLTLQDLSRTLKDAEVEKEMDQILAVLKSKLGATLRE